MRVDRRSRTGEADVMVRVRSRNDHEDNSRVRSNFLLGLWVERTLLVAPGAGDVEDRDLRQAGLEALGLGNVIDGLPFRRVESCLPARQFFFKGTDVRKDRQLRVGDILGAGQSKL